MESDFKPLRVACPNCGNSKLLKIPLSIYNDKKFGIVKIKVPNGAVCQEHQFIILTDNKQNIIGYETIDISIVKLPEEPKEELANGISLKYLVHLFGFNCVAGFLHAKLFNYPSFIITSKDLNVDLNIFDKVFDKLIPEQYRQTHPIKFIKYDSDIYPNPGYYYFLIQNKMKEDFLINLKKHIVNMPWDTDIGYESLIINKSLEIDEHDGFKIVESYLTQFVKDVELTKTTLENHSSITDKNLMKELNQKTKLSTINKDRIKLIREFFQRRNCVELAKRIIIK
ncbi:MAG: hypothetical protein ACFE85_11320 [Candidatus Hodarchaeota archaeon]